MMNIHQWRRAPIGMGRWRRWLTGRGSLTRRLQARCSGFRVQRLRQAVALPYLDETPPFGLRRRRQALIREVLLLCGDTPLVFAHTVIPLGALRSRWQRLGDLGNHSLGATLFADPTIRRFPLEYRRLPAQHPLFRSAAAHFPAQADRLWARRSLFALGRGRIQVTEVFLPTVLELPESP